MANIDFKAFIDEVKERNPIADVIEETPECKLNRRPGREITGVTHTSLTVNVERGVYVWFSHNAEGGDVFTWLMNRNGWDFNRALDYLAQRANMELPQFTPENNQVVLAARRKEDVWGIAQALMSKWLRADSEAWAYATNGPTPSGKPRYFSEQTIREAGLGFTGRGNAFKDEMLAALTAGGHAVDAPEVVAICGFKGDVSRWAAKSHIEPNSNWIGKDGSPGYISGLLGAKRLVFPHVRRGRVIGFSSRNILGSEFGQDGKEHKAYEMPKALVGPKRLYYNYMFSDRCREVVIVEGPGDAVALGQFRVAAVAQLGLPGEKLSEENMQELAALRKYKESGEEFDRTIYLGVDADDPAHKALVGKDEDWPMVNIVGPMARVVRWQADRHCRTFTIQVKGLNGDQPTEKDYKIKDANDYLAGLVQQTLAREKSAPAAATPPADTDGGAAEPAIGKNYEENDDGEGETNPINQAPHERIHSQVLDCAEPLVMAIANWAGRKKGVSRDHAQRFALAVFARLNEIEMGQYRAGLAKALDISVREMNNMLKTISALSEKAKLQGEPVYTWGGFIDEWLVEYLYDVGSDQAMLAWRDPDGRIDCGESIDINGRRYLPYPPTHTMATSGVIFPSAIGEHKSIRELIGLAELFLKRIYILPSDKMARLIAYWVINSWIYDCFETAIYLRAIGPAGSGKSELMKRVGLLCYRMMTASGAATTSSLFRALERYKGSVFIDEADLAQSDTAQDMIKFYNSGAMKNNPIFRTVEVMGPNGERDFEERSFQTFCPKLIAMRTEFKDDAVGSRSLTIKLISREMIELVAKNIPLTINDEIRGQAQQLRNLLLRWRLETWQPQIPVSQEFYDLTISARLNQVAGPLLATAKDDPDQQEEIRRTLREYFQESLLTMNMTLNARVIEAMWKIWNYPDLHKTIKVDSDGNSRLKVGEITKITNAIIDEMNGDAADDDEEKKNRRAVKSQKVGSIIRNEFQLKVGEREKDGYWVFWDQARMLGISMKHGIKPEEFGPQPGAQKAISASAAKPKQDSLLQTHEKVN